MFTIGTLLGVVGSSEIKTLLTTTPLTTKYSEYETSPRMYEELIKLIFIFDDLYVYCLFVFIFRTFQGHILHIVWSIFQLVGSVIWAYSNFYMDTIFMSMTNRF